MKVFAGRAFPLRSICAAFAISCTALTASAAAISYKAVSIGGVQWRYDYSVTASSSEPAIFEFTIFFDVADFANLSSATGAAGWDVLAISPDSAIPADGFVDALALTTGIVPGSTQTGFSVMFEYLGAGTPGRQHFDIVDPDTFELISMGITTPLRTDPTGEIPEPGSLALFGLAFGAAAVSRRRKA